MTDTGPRTWTDEDLDEAYAFTMRAGFAGGELVEAISREIARRAEIRLNRRADVEYGSNRYGFTADEIDQAHDAPWYESRQIEAEFFAEVGYDVHEAECEGSHVPSCPIGQAEREEANRRAAAAQALWTRNNPPVR
jgi:hypothetical protein